MVFLDYTRPNFLLRNLTAHLTTPALLQIWIVDFYFILLPPPRIGGQIYLETL